MKTRMYKDPAVELTAANKVIQELKKRLARQEQTEKQLQRSSLEIRERTKELECLYGISTIVDAHDDHDVIIQEIVNLIPASWQYPEITCAHAVIGKKHYATPNFRKTKYWQHCDIIADERKTGTLEVYYLEKMPESEEGPFLKAERSLIKAVAERIGKIVQRKSAESEIKTSQEKLRELFEYLQTVREEERKRIAHEIHDELGQALTALNIDIRWLKRRVQREAPRLVDKLASMEELVEHTIQNVQRISSDLRPIILEQFGIEAALKWHAKEFQKRSGIKCTVMVDIPTLDDSRGIVIYRIIQELLTNVIRHARATRVSMAVEAKNGWLQIVVSDNGIGIAEKQANDEKSFGLIGLKERVHFWQGDIKISGSPHKGTTITINLPVDTGGNRACIRVFIADDHHVTRKGLKQILEETPDLIIAGEAGTGHELLERVKTGDYDIIVLDLMLPDMNGLEVLKQLRILKPHLPVLIISMFPEEHYVERTLNAGAHGYLSKKSLPDELVEAVRTISRGNRYVSPSFSERSTLNLRLGRERQRHESLSEREYMVMCLIAAGKHVKEIASELSLSVKTVSTHRTHILEKLDLKNNVEISRYAILNRLVY